MYIVISVWLVNLVFVPILQPEPSAGVSDLQSRFNREANSHHGLPLRANRVPLDNNGVDLNLHGKADSVRVNEFPDPVKKKPLPIEWEDKEPEVKQPLENDLVDFDALKRRERLKRNLIDVERLKKSNVIEGQSNGKVGPRDLPNVDENDPLIQLRDKMNDLDYEAKQRLAVNENLSQKSRKAIKEKMEADLRLKNEGNQPGKVGRFQDGNNEMLNRLHGPGIKAIRERFGKVYNKQLEDNGRGKLQEVANKASVSHIAALGEFDMETYLASQRMKEGGGDPMKNFKFNQVASDSTPPDRYLKDVRNPL